MMFEKTLIIEKMTNKTRTVQYVHGEGCLLTKGDGYRTSLRAAIKHQGHKPSSYVLKHQVDYL